VRIKIKENTPGQDSHQPPPKGGWVVGGRAQSKSQEKTDVADIMRLTANLDPKSRQQLLDHLALQAQTPGSANNRDLDMWSSAVYDALQQFLGASAGAMGGPMVVRRVLTVSTAWKPVESFMQSSKLVEIKVVERQSVYSMLARLLVGHAAFVAKKSGAPLSAKLIANCCGSITGVFESAFPGYLHAGLAPMVARRLATGGH
jgi:hypothetical protein